MVSVFMRDEKGGVRAHAGDSFESFAIDASIAAANGAAEPRFCRERMGDDTDELDPVLDFSTGLRPGFFRAREKVGETHSILAHSSPATVWI